ncbi:MAG TPA: HAMP domain-containing sensor histidine kinase [Bryobacteraceae bacterium]|jgi:signal transduction histidine kinase|nr:HAMP domain-containing sensor histidine kinase [Bryobacteraceae bacterium]
MLDILTAGVTRRTSPLRLSGMSVVGRRKTRVFFIALCVLLVTLALTLNVGWIVISWKAGVIYVLGMFFFLAIIAGVVLNTIFLVREIRRNEQHDHFINAVTHELKTPVASIRLYLETLQTRELDEAKKREFYGIMLEDSERLLSTIEQVLRAGRLGKGELHRSVIDMRTLAKETVELARTRHRLETAAIELKCNLPDEEKALVNGDTLELRAALSNLIDNAIKYSGKTVQVEVELAKTDSGKVALRVRDRGVGIPRGELKRIFKRFYRIPGSVAMRVKGTGLGLYIVRSVAEKHGGTAFAESPGTGMGSTFTLQLPLANQL